MCAGYRGLQVTIEPLIENQTVAFDYIKNGAFRTIHVDGAIGSVSPRGDIQVCLYSERSAIPKRITHELKEDGSLGGVVGTESRDAIIRELDVNLILPFAVAVELHAWLGDRIEEAKIREREKK
jgi:hypothetical protein